MSAAPRPDEAVLAAADARGWRPARKVAPVWAKPLDAPQVVETREGPLQARAGDHLCRGADGEPWPQADASLRRKYEPTDEVDEEGFRRWIPRPDLARVWASRLPEAVVLQSSWGPMEGAAGDWLVRPRERAAGEPEDVWIVGAAAFAATYVLEDDAPGPGGERGGGEAYDVPTGQSEPEPPSDGETEDAPPVDGPVATGPDDDLGFEPIEVMIPESAGAVPPPEVLPRKVLAFDLEMQKGDNWCWAAVTQAVARYFADDPTQGVAALTQAEIVNRTLDANGEPHPDCTQEACDAACDRTYYVYRALEEVGHYALRKEPGKPEYKLPREEIDAGRPFVALVKWTGGGGHFLTLYGYDESAGTGPEEALLHVGDPWYGDTLVSYGAFPASYQAGGSWAWSYWTCAAPPADV